MFGDKRSGRIQIKICGITNTADALAAVNCGADALGFNLYPQSKRYIDLEAARDWIDELPGDVYKVAVLVNPTAEEAIRIGESACIDALQLHGQESPQFCRGLTDRGIRFAKAVPVTSARSLIELPSFHTDTLVLDSASPGKFGGTGKTFPWEWAHRFVETHALFNVILAGGLAPENVAQALREVRPYGVDVTSGVESSPGRKDSNRLKAFVEAVRSFGS